MSLIVTGEEIMIYHFKNCYSKCYTKW